MKRLGVTLGLMLIFSSSVMGEEIRYDSGGHRDPFIPLVTADGVVDAKKFNANDIHVEGIIFDPHGGSMVLINGEFYKQGDNVKGANVISIFKDRIVMSQADEEKTLWIREETVKSGDKSHAPSKIVRPQSAKK